MLEYISSSLTVVPDQDGTPEQQVHYSIADLMHQHMILICESDISEQDKLITSYEKKLDILLTWLAVSIQTDLIKVPDFHGAVNQSFVTYMRDQLTVDALLLIEDYEIAFPFADRAVARLSDFIWSSDKALAPETLLDEFGFFDDAKQDLCDDCLAAAAAETAGDC